ncbi:CS1 type fimbrial major subunit, partial [Salmonella enterica subsp. enterica serovar Montevideo]|nr:CS1 type fimbrial major subunit [Salmonella enterica subsp. enterica serovar Montevideo]
MQADGSSLPSTMKLDFMPGKGLVHKSLQTRLYSNDQTKSAETRLYRGKWRRSHFYAHPRSSSLPNHCREEEGQHRAWQTSDNVV